MWDFDIDFGVAVNRIREKMKVTQARLATLIGTTQTEVSFMERGFLPRNPRKVESIIFLARHYNIIGREN
jgi:transcriptional regulator with XRE-family HTH domain